MKIGSDYQPEFESYKTLLLDMARELSLQSLLETIVRQLAERPHIALARIWLMKPGDICSECPMRAKCADQSRCLHLAASSGVSLSGDTHDWTRTDGKFRRFPLGVPQAGEVGKTGNAREIRNIAEESDWLLFPEWARREEIVGYAGQPLFYKDDVLGVLSVFSRIPLPREEILWLRMATNHAGCAIANAKAFLEIGELKKKAELENLWLREELNQAKQFGGIVGNGAAFEHLMKQIELVAPTDAGVLILGESGTGKELVAKEIHERSNRANRPMVTVNCASITRDLYESEFFGHVKGAFTGALKDRSGRFEAADGGTLFLDEVGEIPLELQSKLLRVLQEGEYQRVGEEETRRVDVRIIASTNRDLEHDAAEKKFRQDLYYRLNIFPIVVSPLRHRKTEIPAIAEHFLKEIAGRMNCAPPRLTPANLLELEQYDWPGNVRELRNVIERAVIISRCGPLSFQLKRDENAECRLIGAVTVCEPFAESEVVPDAEFRKREHQNVLAALEKSGWKIYGPDGAAELLGIKPTTLTARIKKMGIEKPG